MHCNALHCTVPYRAVLYCTVLYCIQGQSDPRASIRLGSLAGRGVVHKKKLQESGTHWKSRIHHPQQHMSLVSVLRVK